MENQRNYFDSEQYSLKGDYQLKIKGNSGRYIFTPSNLIGSQYGGYEKKYKEIKFY